MVLGKFIDYDAMITAGVNKIKAKVMYFAVLRFNPRWKSHEEAYDCSAFSERTRCYTEFDRVQSLIEKGKMSITDIENPGEEGFKKALGN